MTGLAGPSDVAHLDVDDVADPRLRDYAGLTDVALRTRSELADGLFIAEGERVVLRALRAGHMPRSLLLSRSRWRLLGDELRAELAARPDLPVLVAADDLLETITGFVVHRGTLACFARPPVPSLADVLTGARRVLVLEEVNNHTNVGAVARSAVALGFDGLVLDPRSADPLYRRAIRVSMGATLTLPFTRLASWPQGLADISAAGFRILAMTPGGDVDLTADLAASGDRIALLLGAEGDGLTPAALAAADLRVRIPMAAGIDSLNIAAAAALACWALRP
jgi:tRNA G18 (ribose-2'-O)-methylase SpoU